MKLQLSLKKQWFDLTASGVKTEDYRELTPYWIKRLMSKQFNDIYPDEKESIETIMKFYDLDSFTKDYGKKFTSNVMTLGYPSKTDLSRIKEYEHLGIEIGYGNPEWGAEPNKLYFVIKHGEEINQ